MSQKFMVVIKREYSSPPEISVILAMETLAIHRADALFDGHFLDTVMVTELLPHQEYRRIYKRERKCKHHNIQFQMDTRGDTIPICTDCNSPIIPRGLVEEVTK